MTHLTVETSFTLLQETWFCHRGLSMWLLYRSELPATESSAFYQAIPVILIPAALQNLPPHFKPGSPLQNHSERVWSTQQRSAAKPLGMKTISRVPHAFERNIRQITSLGFTVFHNMASYHPQRHLYSKNRYVHFLD